MHLFHFIKNLDTAEIKYFRAFAKRRIKKGDSAPLMLFDLILGCIEYDEERFAREVRIANFPALKVYLYDMIAEAMLEREMKKKGLPEIFALSQQAEMFQRKSLMDGMWKKMDKAMLLCERYEEFGVWRDLLRKKQSILMQDAVDGVVPEGMEDFDEVYPEVVAKWKNFLAYQELEDLLEIARRKGDTATYETAMKLRENPLLAEETPRLSNRAELLFCYLKRSVERRCGNYPATAFYSKKIVGILENHPILMLAPELELMYVGGIHYGGLYAAALREFDEAAMAIRKLQSFKGMAVPIFERVHSIELRLAFAHGNNEQGLAVISAISAGFETHQFKVKAERKVSYFYQIAHFHIFFSQAEMALKWVLRLREIKNPNTKKDLQDFGEVLFLICHFDIGNYEFIFRTEAEKALNFLSKRDGLTIYEETIIKGLRKAAKADSVKNRNNRLIRIAEKLRELRCDPRFGYKDNFFQFDFWLQAHLNGNTPNYYLRNAPNSLD